MDEGDNRYEVSPLIAAAHELKAPLALVRQLALRLENDTLSEADRSRLLRQAVLTSERALRLTSDLTRSVRLNDLTLFELEPINPEQICRDVLSELSPLFKAYGRTAGIKGGRRSSLLVANRDLLRRIILSFSDNALRYSLPGSEIRINIQSDKRVGVVRIGVRDYGPALPSDIWRTLQSKLRTAPQSIHARPESSGLGLYIASQFAEAMNGKIGAIRHRDGATFYVELQASAQLSLL